MSFPARGLVKLHVAARGLHWTGMGEWYTIGVAAGLGTDVGVLLAGGLSTRRIGILTAAIVAAAVGAVVGLLVENWDEALAAAIGGVLGVLGTAQIVRGALRRGGTRGWMAFLVAGAAILTAALAFIPIV